MERIDFKSLIESFLIEESSLEMTLSTSSFFSSCKETTRSSMEFSAILYIHLMQPHALSIENKLVLTNPQLAG